MTRRAGIPRLAGVLRRALGPRSERVGTQGLQFRNLESRLHLTELAEEPQCRVPARATPSPCGSPRPPGSARRPS
ncbi:hypothetical protein BN12_2030017 [Nostocoides japonicum T1-X7]|uniref:Uncharacterized protein n=1 Tax=Nostocoides japonicum T1-X7 TaxID=1194083 RepID=A0A077LUN9_9MICO|nr:hypothetical protein BN12_2030017 [Tetrasphaera japonica T1-X7]